MKTKATMVGAGKLGLPVALAWAKTHDMVCYDKFPHAEEILRTKKYPHREPGAQKLLDEGTTLRAVDSIDEAVAHGDLVFVSVQTPHGIEYEGVTRMPEKRADFDYTMLRDAVVEICDAAEKQHKHVTLVVISTVLPGTSAREILPFIDGGGNNQYVSYVYAPMFIAQSTVVEDALNPEFVLLGIDKTDARGREEVTTFFSTLHPKKKLRLMSVASAEATKVAYNTFLGLKIVAINAWMEIAHKTGANVDEISDALEDATERVISSKYMRGGMGDGGGCFVEGQLIHVEDGIKAIDEIEKGDRVLGGDGLYHEVLETYRRPYKGKVYTIKGRGLTRFTVTGEHPIHVAIDQRTILSNGRRNQNDGPQFGSTEEVRAADVNEDCYIVFPSPKATSVREAWSPPRGKSGPAPRPIFTDSEAYTLIAGYFMGEGCIWFDKEKNYLPSRVTFSFNTLTDGDYIAECVAALKVVIPSAPIKVFTKNSRESCTEVRVDSTQLAKQLDHDCGHGYENKKIPAWILNHDRNSALCLRALFRGDGSSHDSGLSFSTVSTHLAHGVSLMLRRHGIPSALQYHPKRVGADGVVHRPAYDLGVNNAAHIEKLAEIVGMPIRHQMQEKRYPNTIFERDGFWYHYVNSIETSDYEGTVYNLNVADVHNYVSVGGLVSNCHPRDQIALSWLAESLELSYDLFGAMVEAREKQTEWLAELAMAESRDGKLPIVLLGTAYKAGTNLTMGSPAVLLKNMLTELPHLKVEQWDPHVDIASMPAIERPVAVYIVATNHEEFFDHRNMNFPAGSVVIDPWGKMPFRPGIKIIHVGRTPPRPTHGTYLTAEQIQMLKKD